MYSFSCILKYAVLLFCFLPPTVHAHNTGQSRKIILKGESITMQEAIQIIEANSTYTFFFKSGMLSETEKKDYNLEGDIHEILKGVFTGSGITYVIKNNEIILKGTAKQAPQQSKQKERKTEIVGVVADADTGEGIIGASVQLKGTSTGTITDLDGQFKIMASPSDAIVISFIGYISQEIKIGSHKLFSIELHEDSKQLDEVVITAYGTGQKKASMVGSVESIKPSELQIPSTNLSTAFAGRLAGVVAVQRSGQPGADGANFWIRGVSTMNGVTNPLIILDGVQVSSSDLNNLDPEIIDNFSILKDATATAMYGTRGANGVMIVTTKSGMNLDKPIINFRMEAQMSQPTSTPRFVNGATYMELFNEAVNNDNSGDVLYSEEKIAGTRAGLNPYIYPNVNWYDELFTNHAFNEKFNFNIRGGGKRVNYFSSISVNHESGMLKNRSRDFFSYSNNINIMRYNFQNNINAELSKTSKLSLRLNVQLRDMTSPNQGVGAIFTNAMDTSPVEFPVYFPDDGSTPYVKWGSTERINADYQTNPVAQAATGYNKGFQSTVIAALEFNQKLNFITKGLSFKALASFKNWSSSNNMRSGHWNKFSLTGYEEDGNGGYNYMTSRIGDEYQTNLSASNSTSGNRRFYIEGMLNYSRTFDKHDVNAMIIYNQDELVNNVPGNGNFIGSLPQRKQGLAARASYTYAGKYLAEVNVGYNGSENFAKGHRFGFFPSVALGYNISEEPYFKPLKNIVSKLKLRGSWGLVGNDQINGSRFIYMSQIDLNGIGYTTGINQNVTYNGPVYQRYANENITWEVGEKLNFGVDLQLFRSLDLTFDIFRENRRDIFQQKQTIPTYMGTASTKVYGNLAAMRNQGFELAANYNKKINKEWFVSFKGTFTYAHNKITKYDEAPKYPWQSKIGVSANTNGIYVSDGLFIDAQDIAHHPQQLGMIISPGDIKYINISKDWYGYEDNLTDTDDWVWSKYPVIPEIVYGFGPSIKWKNLDFSFFFQGVSRTSFILNNFHPFGDNMLRNVLSWVADERWSPDNQDTNATYPRLSRKTNSNNNKNSSYWERNGAFLKLKNAEIGYTYKHMRLYISGSNLLTFAPFKLWAPEQGGGNGLSYPTQRVFNIGFQMTINNK